jgi:hypothetical protein
MNKKVLWIGLAVAIGIIAIYSMVGAQDASRFFRLSGENTVYKAYATAVEFFSDGGAQDFSNVEVVEPNIGGASGISATQSIATTTAVGPQQNIQIYAKNPSCSSRVISTRASNIMIIFGDPVNNDISSTTLSGIIGFYQAASTTIAYDAEIYGCGRWFGYSFSSSTITRAEF